MLAKDAYEYTKKSYDIDAIISSITATCNKGQFSLEVYNLPDSGRKTLLDLGYLLSPKYENNNVEPWSNNKPQSWIISWDNR